MKTVGSQSMAAGLVLIGRPEIDTGENGMKFGTLRFKTLHANNPAKEPVRGTLCPDFTAGDDLTGDVLDSLDYLAAHTAKWTLNGGGQGIDLLDVLVKGANLGAVAGTQGVASVAITTQGEDYVSKPAITFFGGGAFVQAVATTWLEVVYESLASGGSGYAAGEEIEILGGGYVAGHNARIQVSTVSGGGAILTFIFIDRGKYSNLPTGGEFYFARDGVLSGGHFIGSLRLSEIDITTAGSYSGTPTVALSGGGTATPATLGAVTMGAASQAAGGTTNPFLETSHTKLTVNDGTADYVFYAVDLSLKYVCSFKPGQALYLSTDHIVNSGDDSITIISPYPITPPLVVEVPLLYDQYGQPVDSDDTALELAIELNDLRSRPAGAMFDVEESARVIWAPAPP